MRRDTMTMWGYTLAVAAVGVIGAGTAWAEKPQGAGDRGEAKQRSTEGERPRSEAREGERPRGPREDQAARGPRDGGRGLVRELFDGIELTDSQKQQVREVMVQARDEREAWMAENGEKLRELRERMEDARAVKDTEAMQSIGQEARTMMSGGPQPMAVAEDVRGILTPEQAEKFDANVERVRERVQERMRGGPGGRGAGPQGDRGPGGPEGRRDVDNPEARGGAGDRGPRAEGEVNGVDREAIRERLEKFRERREAKSADGPPKVSDEMFTDEMNDAATQPDEAESEKSDGEQLDL